MKEFNASTAQMENLDGRHPRQLYMLFFAEMWERFSFYGMKALLLFLIKHHKFGDDTGYDVIGAYGGLVYCIPVIGSH